VWAAGLALVGGSAGLFGGWCGGAVACHGVWVWVWFVG